MGKGLVSVVLFHFGITEYPYNTNGITSHLLICLIGRIMHTGTSEKEREGERRVMIGGVITSEHQRAATTSFLKHFPVICRPTIFTN